MPSQLPVTDEILTKRIINNLFLLSTNEKIVLARIIANYSKNNTSTVSSEEAGLATITLRRTVDKILTRYITLVDKECVRKLQWLIEVVYCHDIAKVTMHAEVIASLKESYSDVKARRLIETPQLKSLYAARLLRLIRTHTDKNQHAIGIPLQDLKNELAVFDKYPGYPEFNRSVLSKAVNELNTILHMNITVQTHKNADRFTDKITFGWSKPK